MADSSFDHGHHIRHWITRNDNVLWMSSTKKSNTKRKKVITIAHATFSLGSFYAIIISLSESLGGGKMVETENRETKKRKLTQMEFPGFALVSISRPVVVEIRGSRARPCGAALWTWQLAVLQPANKRTQASARGVWAPFYSHRKRKCCWRSNTLSDSAECRNVSISISRDQPASLSSGKYIFLLVSLSCDCTQDLRGRLRSTIVLMNTHAKDTLTKRTSRIDIQIFSIENNVYFIN